MMVGGKRAARVEQASIILSETPSTTAELSQSLSLVKDAPRRIGIAALLLLLLAFAPAGAAAPPSPVKTLRITFQAAESGFDPVRVSDVYSSAVIEAIFEPLLTYDYLA